MIAAPHSGYIPGVGFAIGVAVAGAAAARRSQGTNEELRVTSDELRGTSEDSRRASSRSPVPDPRSLFPGPRSLDLHLARTAAWFFLISMAVFSMFTRWQWEGIAAAERLMLHSLRQSPPER